MTYGQKPQLNIFPSQQELNYIETQREKTLSDSSKRIQILFRNTIPEIPSTTYGTFSIYKYPAKFIPLLSRAWGFVHSLEDEIKYTLLIPLLKVTRYFSWSDEKVHKLYKSKYSKKKIESLLKADWRNKFYEELKKELLLLLRKIYEYDRLNPKEVKYRIKSGVNTLENNLEEETDILITSPPYLQAQEYIRSTKLELF